MPVPPRQLDRVRGLLAAVDTLFPDLAFLGSEGTLEVRLRRPVAAHTLRVEVQEQALGLQSVGILAKGGRQVTELDSVEVSSLWAPVDDPVDPGRLLDFENPSGTVFRTRRDHPAWLELHFHEDVPLKAVRLRNIQGVKAADARGIRVTAITDRGTETLYDGALRSDLMRQVLAQQDSVGGAPLKPALLRLLGHVAASDYAEAKEALGAPGLSRPDAREIRALLNAGLLAHREIEWTSHGPSRSFRFWSQAEKVDYVRMAAQVADALGDLTPHVTFAFGSALAVARDGDLIPHDDDIDLIVAFEAHEAETLAAANARLEEFLTDRGFEVTGDFLAHRKVSRGGGKAIDVFVGLREGDHMASFPAPRGAVPWEGVFPTSTREFLGAQVPVPNDLPGYLAAVYGPDWRKPDPDFRHAWTRSRTEYSDIRD